MPEIREAVREDAPLRTGRTVTETIPPRRGFLVLLIPLSIGLNALAARHPAAVETVYSRGLSRLLRETLGRIFGAASFSFAEIFLYLLILFFLAWLPVQIARLLFRERKGQRLLYILATLGAFAGVAYFLFTVFCGLGYSRVTFADQSGLLIRDSSTEEVAQLYAELVAAAGELRPMMDEDENGVTLFSRSSYEAAIAAKEGMDRLALKYPVLGGYTPPAKPVLASRGMSYLNITGVYIPFTFEANVNADVPDHGVPFTMLHELSHFKGFMREDEANFIAYLACRESGDEAIAYSGTVTALVYVGNALYGASPELYSQISAYLNDGVRRDFAASSAYWRQFEGPVAEAASAVNDSYLKSNRQEDGVRSYGRMVDLLLADFRERHGLE